MHLTNRNKNTKMHRHAEMVKENVFEDGVVPLRWVIAAAVVTALSLAVAALVDHRLPEPLDRTAPPDRFIAEIAHEHLVNLTSIGPRVTGSYENEVLAVQILVEAVKSIAAQASPHNRIDYDVFSASGAFSLTFLDGMSNVYRDVQSVVVRARGAGGRPAAVRTALLLNCHFDTVPDSPGASDDAAGCAVALETLRALVAAPRPLRHDVLVLLNGAEENILQASHAFVTQHPWAKSVRAFINIEACGAGGREVLFQAGPHDPWIMEVYAGAVPHPFASSLAQELFESGLIPADTDFRIFRDYGNLSGVDLAWNSNGYVYHTHLDTAARVPPATLQRTGDNVLALALGLLSNERLERPTERERQPVFFDVVGAFVIAARAPAAALAVVVTLATLALSLHFSAAEAAKRLYISRRAWWWVVLRAARNVALTQGAGAAAALVPALLLHATGARLSFYASPALLVPLYALPALCGAWADSRFAWRGRLAPARGWWEWRAWRDALALWAGAMLAAGALAGLRSAFLPLLWTLPALAALPRCSPATSAALHAALSALPALQSAYLALGSVDMFVPIMGRAGTAPLPADVMMSLVVSSLTLTTFSWMLPLVVAARKPAPLIYAGALVSALTCALVLLTPLGAPYSAERPQRVMVFHTRRTLHGPEPVVENFYWLPELDVNTPHSLDEHVDGMRAARAGSAEECARWVYCGAPYYLPVLSLVARGHRLPAPAPPLAELRVRAELRADGPLARTLALELDGPSHVVVILAPAAGARVTRCSELEGAPQPGPPWAARRTYFLALHRARRPRPPRPWRLECRLERAAAAQGEGAPWVQVSAAGHAMSGAAQRHERHAALLAALPASAAATGWGVDLHLLEL